MVNSLLQWVNPRGKSRLGVFFRSILFWNPLAVTVMTLFFYVPESWEGYIYGYSVSLVISTMCTVSGYVTAWMVAWVDATIVRARGGTSIDHGAIWYIVVSIPGCYFGFFLGLDVVEFIFGLTLHRTESAISGGVIAILFALAYLLNQITGDLKDAKRLAELRTKEAENERLRGQIAALTAQMNPHVLFNTLNTIASLTHSDPKAAEETTVELAELYRGVLNAAKQDSHSLADELAICEAYLKIEQARFGERLQYEIKTEGIDPASVHIPPLMLQPLVENAVKHGLAPKADGGRVAICVASDGQQLSIDVRDNGVGFQEKTASKHESTGLQNLETRLTLLHGDAARLSAHVVRSGGTRVRITLPREVEV